MVFNQLAQYYEKEDELTKGIGSFHVSGDSCTVAVIMVFVLVYFVLMLISNFTSFGGSRRKLRSWCWIFATLLLVLVPSVSSWQQA